MNKKTLGIILVVLIVAIGGAVYFGSQKSLFTGKGIGIKGIGKKSIMDAAREQGQTVMSKSEFIDECKKSDKESQDMCYGLGALYYRDVSFCKWIKDSEARKNCNQKNIEKWYSDIEKGGAASPFMPGGLAPSGEMIPGGGMFPGGGIIPSEETDGGIKSEEEIEDAEPENIPSDASSQTEPTVESSGKMTDEIYIEILAQTGYYAQKDPNTFASHMKDLYQKYGITEEDITAYGKELEKNPQHAGELGLKYMKRVQELQATGK